MGIGKRVIIVLALVAIVSVFTLFTMGGFVLPLINRSSNTNVILNERVFLNNTYDPYNPFNPYPFEYKVYDMQLSKESYQINVHTTDTVYVLVKMDSCYDEVLYHCTRLDTSFTSSESPPNIATFTVTQDGKYSLTVSLPRVGSLRGACGGYNQSPCPAPSANVEVNITRA